MFESRKELTERVQSLETDLKETEESLKTAEAALTTAQEAQAQAAQDFDAEKKAHEETKATLADTEKDRDEKANELTTATEKLESFDAEVEKAAKAKSAQYLEKLGHAPLELGKDGEDPTDPPAKDAAEEVLDINDPEELYEHVQKNREEIKAALFAKRA